MKQIPPIKSVMTPFPYHTDGSQTLQDALRMMEQHDIRHLPVMQGGEIVSVITDGDVRLALGPALGAERLRVSDVVHREAYRVELTEPLDVVVSRMADEHIDCAVVLKNSRLVGIFTMTDACRCLGGMLRTLFPRGQGDDAA